MTDLWGRIQETIYRELDYTGETPLSEHLTNAIFAEIGFSPQKSTTATGSTIARWLTRWEHT